MQIYAGTACLHAKIYPNLDAKYKQIEQQERPQNQWAQSALKTGTYIIMAGKRFPRHGTFPSTG